MCECDLVQIKNSFQQQFNGSLAEWIKVWLKIVWLYVCVWLYMCECNIVQIKNSFQQQFNGSLVDQGIAQCVVICINVVIYVWFYIYISVTGCR